MTRSRDDSGKSQMMSGSGTSPHRLSTNSAFSYLKVVKDTFEDDKDTYDEFLAVMKQFKAQNIDTDGVIERVKDLFRDHRDLILGFNTFLPSGYDITLPPEPESPQPKRGAVQYEEAHGFVAKIKRRFPGNDNVYNSFVNTLNLYKRQHKSVSQVSQEIGALFRDHPDLLEEFGRFLPDQSWFDKAQGSRNSMPDEDEKNRENEQHMLMDSEMNKRREKDKREREFDHNVTHKRKSARIEDIHLQIAQGMHDQDFDLFQKVKDTKQNNVFLRFIKCLQTYHSDIITRTQLCMMIRDLLGAESELMSDFNKFLARCDKSVGHLGSILSKKYLWSDGGNTSRPLKIEDQDNKAQDRVRLTRERVKTEKLPGPIELIDQKMPSYASKDTKYMFKSIQELDLSNCTRCTPSYRLLPNDYMIPLVSNKTAIGNEVLNDKWVSVTSGSEDYSNNHMRKNQYEESLSRCEDDRFELDMLMESVNATIIRCEELQSELNDNTTKQEVEDYFTTSSLRCMERLYGDHGLDVMDLLRKNADIALPVILARLKQKQNEWAKCRVDFNKIWADVYFKNHEKSLDHRSFYFKQQDKKSLSTKALLSEIKAYSDKQRNEDDVLLCNFAGHRQPINPDMEFEYPDLDVHNDLYALIKVSCLELCSEEQYDAIMKLWTTFVEHILGCPFRPQDEEEDTEDVANDDNLSESPEGNIVIEEENHDSYEEMQIDTIVTNEELLSSNAAKSDVENCLGFCAEEGPIDDDSKGDNCTQTVTVPSSIEAIPQFSKLLESYEIAAKEKAQETDAINNSAVLTHTSSEISENASQNDNMLGTESPGPQVCSSENENENENKPERSFESSKPLSRHNPKNSQDMKRNSRIFYGNDSFYVLFRLHHKLYERLQNAKLYFSSQNKKGVSTDTPQSDSYERMMIVLHNLLKGDCDNVKFEDDCRAIMGTQSYFFSTVDKLIYKLVRQLNLIASDEVHNSLLELFVYEESRNPTTFSDANYHDNAYFVLPDENIYRIECLYAPTRLTIQLMGYGFAKPEVEDINMDRNFAAYMENEYLRDSEKEDISGIFLQRNKKLNARGDEYLDNEKAMEGVNSVNNLLLKKFCSASKKITYVVYTEDYFYRTKKSRREMYPNVSSRKPRTIPLSIFEKNSE